jgi:hypothetical protein
MKRAVLALTMIGPVLSACTPGADGPMAIGKEDQQQAFRTVAQGAYSTVGQRTVTVLRDEAAWKAFAAQLGPGFSLGAVDWEKEQLLVLFAGERTSGGYRVEVTQITAEGGAPLVSATEVQPDPTCAATQALTYPFAVIAMPRSTRDPVARWTTRTGPRC